VNRRPLSPADRERLALPIVGQCQRRRPADFADIACSIGALLIAAVLTFIAWGNQ
jgi:hypothetical protein